MSEGVVAIAGGCMAATLVGGLVVWGLRECQKVLSLLLEVAWLLLSLVDWSFGVCGNVRRCCRYCWRLHGCYSRWWIGRLGSAGMSEGVVAIAGGCMAATLVGG